jgi:hypothetical protein
VIQTCGEDMEVPCAKLLPFLTRDGKAAVTSLMAARH